MNIYAMIKQNLSVHFNKKCTDKFYTSRFDIGGSFANDLREHMYKCVDSPVLYINVTKNKEIFYLKFLILTLMTTKK